MTVLGASLVRSVEADSETDALEMLHREGWTDGLPVVIPTAERVEAMVQWSYGLDGDVVLGLMGPSQGEATVAKVAINAVMAGCRPEYFPVVLAATQAILDPTFNLGPIQETTHCVTPLIIVNGPIRSGIDLASGAGVLGPGHRANATIGRALRLIMMNVGGGYIGVGDMATFGTPAKYSLCVAEAEEESPFAPLHAARGLELSDSAVTVVPIEEPHTVVSLVDGDDVAGSAERLIVALGAGLACVTSTSIYNGEGSVAVLINPDHAATLSKAGMSRQDVLVSIWEAAVQPRGTLRKYLPAMVTGADDEELYRAVNSPEGIILAVCGAPGNYSVALPTWGAPVDLGHAITLKVREPSFCEV